ncbi:hypothetical protein KL918_000705 [Ogataea parapolymorpha]|uniref:Uncharacterized protein n=1 Tax=Ogataea parapolymorpha (strain ATCC 26012 / BCRC 20466 / JCM 22074 / NRRL Y-7560 / DL-1) TaxID=871575 RepID=W1Q8G1_OGAPD|nr:hypothetical protein HPODL_01205 [Ogataea parapolymorpha DL-1]ESW97095.1 hypothetical protein HPODL_01205 [Ogataea parapolymorpha DL-1]KAG7869160.1 hypothetical protein KL918_000705 [Ogataea parapolymorpha]KAG7875789.1 hypothetical protein KL916_000460 [Ogataea parapolymorpha]KAG7877386.1 hypothetical protein KL938_004142 [Ogataea parapolymorpha]
MFGTTLAGRPVKLADQIDTLKYVTTYENISANRISHLSIFLVPNVPFDPSYGALIYYQFQKGGVPLADFRLLGGLDANKQSAIFKINPEAYTSGGQQQSVAKEGDIDMDIEIDPSAPPVDTTLVIGISIEPLTVAAAQLEQLKLSKAPQLSLPAPPSLSINDIPLTKEQVESVSNKIIKNAYDYLSSFVDSSNKVPIKKFDDWWAKFKSKLATDPKFLDNLN